MFGHLQKKKTYFCENQHFQNPKTKQNKTHHPKKNKKEEEEEEEKLTYSSILAQTLK